MENQKQLINLIHSEIDIPNHKVKYVIEHIDLLVGLFGKLIVCGYPKNENTIVTLETEIGSRLSGSEDVEYEWSEKAYNNFKTLRTYINK